MTIRESLAELRTPWDAGLPTTDHEWREWKVRFRDNSVIVEDCVYSFCARRKPNWLLRDEELLHEVTQQTVFGYIRKKPSHFEENDHRPAQNLHRYLVTSSCGWIKRIRSFGSENCWYDARQLRAKYAEDPLLLASREVLSEWLDEASYSRRKRTEIVQLVKEALAELAPSHQEIIRLRDFEELNFEQIRHIFCPEVTTQGAVASRYSKAIEALRMKVCRLRAQAE